MAETTTCPNCGATKIVGRPCPWCKQVTRHPFTLAFQATSTFTGDDR